LGGVLDQLEAAGVQNVIALRGDPPKGSTEFVVAEGGFAHASELAAFVKRRGNFCIAGACYPEKHPEADSLDSDLEKLKRKVDAGAQFLITQLFFDNADYFSFVERARKLGIDVPIIAGIMPVTNVSQIKRFTAMCGAGMPNELMQKLEPVAADADAVGEIGVQHAVAQCRELIARGAPGVHFYTLNRSKATVEILKRLR
jgi:methylenetetrahydrofolate reductase (NADPH)